jgi:hypothetical protein
MDATVSLARFTSRGIGRACAASQLAEGASERASFVPGAAWHVDGGVAVGI